MLPATIMKPVAEPTWLRQGHIIRPYFVWLEVEPSTPVLNFSITFLGQPRDFESKF